MQCCCLTLPQCAMLTWALLAISAQVSDAAAALKAPDDLSTKTFFCSELVTCTYQYAGILSELLLMSHFRSKRRVRFGAHSSAADRRSGTATYLPNSTGEHTWPCLFGISPFRSPRAAAVPKVERERESVWISRRPRRGKRAPDAYMPKHYRSTAWGHRLKVPLAQGARLGKEIAVKFGHDAAAAQPTAAAAKQEATVQDVVAQLEAKKAANVLANKARAARAAKAEGNTA